MLYGYDDINGGFYVFLGFILPWDFTLALKISNYLPACFTG
jgi:hypothetical protein